MKGDPGAKGDAGARGETGARGEQGPKGAPGAKGEQGAKGEKGEQGARGEQGAKGDAGAKGEAGATGATGATGAQGPAGPAGPSGPAGTSSAREAYRDGDVALDDDRDVSVVTMTDVAPGSYVVLASSSVIQEHSLGRGRGATTCTLDAGSGSTDEAETEFGLGQVFGVTRARLQLTVLASFDKPGTIVLRCQGDSGPSWKAAVARRSKIVIVKVDTIARAAVDG